MPEEVLFSELLYADEDLFCGAERLVDVERLLLLRLELELKLELEPDLEAFERARLPALFGVKRL